MPTPQPAGPLAFSFLAGGAGESAMGSTWCESVLNHLSRMYLLGQRSIKASELIKLLTQYQTPPDASVWLIGEGYISEGMASSKPTHHAQLLAQMPIGPTFHVINERVLGPGHLAMDFRKLAERFRRLHTQSDSMMAQRELEAASAWGARLVKRAVDCGYIELDVEWPTDDLEIGWAVLWFSFALSPRPLSPPNPLVLKTVGKAPGVVRSEASGKDWRQRAENFAIVADRWGDVIGSTIQETTQFDTEGVTQTAGRKRDVKKREEKVRAYEAIEAWEGANPDQRPILEKVYEWAKVNVDFPAIGFKEFKKRGRGYRKWRETRDTNGEV